MHCGRGMQISLSIATSESTGPHAGTHHPHSLSSLTRQQKGKKGRGGWSKGEKALALLEKGLYSLLSAESAGEPATLRKSH